MKLLTVAEMQSVEHEANARGWTYAQMMESAGQGLAEYVTAFYGQTDERNVLGLVGSGNNGGDTLIALERLAQQGWHADAYLVRPPRAPEDDLVRRLVAAGGLVQAFVDDADFVILDTQLWTADVVLDGVLGTGLRLPLKPDIARVLQHVQERLPGPVVVAVDCPSGVDCDTGQAAAETIPATLTVCMAAAKVGLLRFPAFSLCGAFEHVDIGLPDGLPTWDAVTREMVMEEDIAGLLPPRDPNGHKGTFGTVQVVAGSMNYTGAAYLCSAAAYRIGAGLVQIATLAGLHAALAGQIPEAVWLLLPEEAGAIAASAAEVLIANRDKPTVRVWGPGMGLTDGTAELVRQMVDAQAAQPLQVIDADGLKLLARVADWPQKLPSWSVLTPHPGEMAVLTGKRVEAIQADRETFAREYARLWGHVVVLKGAQTIIAAPDGRMDVIPVATSALAHAGSGDVLAGMIAGLRAQGIPAFDAAVAGAWLHAQSGLLAAEQVGHVASVRATDLLQTLPEVLAWVW